MLNLTALYATQRKLDQRIVQKHRLEGTVFKDEKLLALLVELGELANETRCFKFWSMKGPSESTVILEEYVDGIHFILSIGLDYDYTDVPLSSQSNSECSMSERFLLVFSRIEQFRVNPTKTQYQLLFEAFLFLGHQLGFSTEQIEHAYHEKNRINHERQDQNY